MADERGDRVAVEQLMLALEMRVGDLGDQHCEPSFR